MKILLKPFQLLYVIYAMAMFVVLMIPVFLWAIIVSPFGRIMSGNLIYKACQLWADLWLVMVFIWHRNIYEHKPESNSSYIYVSNHISYLDSAVVPRAFRKQMRALGKVEMGKIPIFGYIYRNAIVTVDRSSPENRARSVQLLKSTLAKGISILVFPEGTFNTTNQPLLNFYDGAFRIAQETGASIAPVLLLDTYDRMNYRSVFSLNPGRSRAVFLEPVSMKDWDGRPVTELKAHIHGLMTAALERYHASWIKQPS